VVKGVVAKLNPWPAIGGPRAEAEKTIKKRSCHLAIRLMAVRLAVVGLAVVGLVSIRLVAVRLAVVGLVICHFIRKLPV
jgi:hypothetical protein